MHVNLRMQGCSYIFLFELKGTIYVQANPSNPPHLINFFKMKIFFILFAPFVVYSYLHF